MIFVQSIRVQEFRGIRDLTITFNGKNFAVCGPNGTGKSGIVDALEFGLTGSISRLTGKGRGALSVKEHGPHVNIRAKPENAIVTLDVIIASTGKSIRIIRNAKTPRVPVIEPNEPAARAALDLVEKHPEFTLSRREIIRYVLAEPGERAKEIQALLQLDKLETTRGLLQKISNACGRDLKQLETVRAVAADQLMLALGITDLKIASLLAVVNQQRAILELAALERIEATTNIRDGLETQAAKPSINVPKIQARIDLAAAQNAIEAIFVSSVDEARLNAIEKISDLKVNEIQLAQLSRDSMLQAALEHFDGEQCPVCTTPWKPETFREVVTSQRLALAQAARLRTEAERALAPVLTAIEALPSHLALVIRHAGRLPQPVDVQELVDVSARASRLAKVMRAFLPLDATLTALNNELLGLAQATPTLAQFGIAIEALPEPSLRDAARDTLTLGQERLENWRKTSQKHAIARDKNALADEVYITFVDTCDLALNSIYDDVEEEFRALYRLINSDDESSFTSKLKPSSGRLGFEVDFYGKGSFPPGAYHSEGHQDGMGLCLYLALMKYLQGSKFTFAVLDDVLMSVDAGHRREICSLLRTQFPKTQFVLTTHDHVWLNHMRHSNLVDSKSAITFRKWHVDHGPSEWKHTDVWAEIDDLVDKHEIRAAAAQLRNYLEYVSAEWCARLGGQVEFRSHGKYDLGDLLPGAIGAMNRLYKAAKAAAQSWADKARQDAIDIEHTAFSVAVAGTNAEQWQMNPAIHYNEWENLQRQDFKPVVSAFKELELRLQCPACGDGVYVVRSGNEKEAVRCACTNINLNLRKKPSPR